MRSALLALPFTLCASLAAAEPATPEGAADLTALLQTYLGATDGVITVTPAGDAYGVTLDFAPLVPKDAGAEVAVTPIEFTLADNGDGTWAMTQDQAIDLSLKVPGAADISVKVGKLSSTGTFDEALQTFSTSTTTATDMAISEKITDPAGTQTDVAYTIGSMDYTTTGTANADGGVDVAVTSTMATLSETVSMTGAEGGMPPMAFTATVDSGTSDGTITGLRPDAAYKLLAFVVANPDEAAMAAKQGELKTILKDGLPLFAHMGLTGGYSGMKVVSPIGEIGLSEVTVALDANGIVDDGLFREAISVKGLTLPAGVVPDWAAQMVPQEASIDFSASRFNLAAPVAILLDTIDLANPQPNTPEQDQALLAALLPDGVVDITLAPGTITSPLYGLTYEGSMSAGPNTPMPTGKATVTLTGLTAVQQALAAAPPEVGGQVAPMLGMAEAMAKPGENGALVWELEMTAEGGMLVNGTNMMGGN